MSPASGKPINMPRLLARDRRTSAMHEAGHVTIARHFRVPAFGWRYYDAARDPLESSNWGGAECFASWRYSMLTPGRRAMLAVAGLVAENAWHCRAWGGMPDTWEWAE